jgi:hypothetical protein
MNSGSRKITRDSQEQRKQRFETTKKVEFCLQSEYPPSLWTISSKYSFNWLTTQNYITGHSGPLSFTIAVRARSLCLGPIVFISSDVACICHWMPDKKLQAELYKQALEISNEENGHYIFSIWMF